MTKKQKKMLIRILCSFVLLVAAAIVEKLLPDWKERRALLK